MSQADVERFIEDLKTDEGLCNELAGHGSGIGSVVEFAKGKGYDITADEARAYLEANVGRELTDDELDNVSGGNAVAVVVNVTEAWVTTQAHTASIGQTAEVAAAEAVVGTQAVAVLT